MEPPAPHSGGYLLKIRSGAPAYSQIFTKTQKCLSAPLETVRSHFHKSYVTNNASALFTRQPENQRTLTFAYKINWPLEEHARLDFLEFLQDKKLKILFLK